MEYLGTFTAKFVGCVLTKIIVKSSVAQGRIMFPSVSGSQAWLR